MARRNRVRKHRKDQNNGKNGWVGGNPRYDRRDPEQNRSMRQRGTCLTRRATPAMEYYE